MNINTPGHTDDSQAEAAEPLTFEIRSLSGEQLAKLGVSQLAYVKPIILNGSPAFAIHAADGTPMAVSADWEVAIAAIRQHDLVPVWVH
jgi:hypothetical protein